MKNFIASVVLLLVSALTMSQGVFTSRVVDAETGEALRAYGAGVVPVAHDISSNYKAQIRPYWHTGTFANMALMWHESKIKGIVEDCIKDKSYQTFEHRNKDTSAAHKNPLTRALGCT